MYAKLKLSWEIIAVLNEEGQRVQKGASWGAVHPVNFGS